MKILHTADWHLGRQLNQNSLIEDQRYILDRFVEIVEREKPDVIVIAGDIYDRSVPSKEAVDLFDEFISKLVIEQKQKIIAIAGNHDSPERIGLHNRILEKQNLHLIGNLESPVKVIPIEDEFGPVNFYVVPFTEPSYYNYLYKGETAKTHQDFFNSLIDKLGPEKLRSERNVLVSHSFAAGGVKSESERMMAVGTAEVVDAGLFSPFNYVALGHLHSPQDIVNNRVRYSGSLLKYSKSETEHKKSVTICELDSTGKTAIREIPLIPSRDVHLITGKIKNGVFVLAPYQVEHKKDDLLFVQITNTEPVMDAMRVVQETYPNALSLDWVKIKASGITDRSFKSGEVKDKNPLELCEEFYQSIADKSLITEEKVILQNIINQVTGGN